MSADPSHRPRPRTFTSAGEALRDSIAVLGDAGTLAAVYLRGHLDPELRERVMVAVSRVNACAGCTQVHQRWALRAGVSADELEAIGLGDLAGLDERSRTAVVYAAEFAAGRFRAPVSPDVEAAAGEHLSASELAAVEAIARAIALANLTVSTAATISRSGAR